MLQKTILILVLFFNTQVFSQRGDAILILKDSTEIIGKGGVYANSLLLSPKFGNDTLKYKYYNADEIIGIDILEEDYYRQFRYKYKDGKKYPELVEIMLLDSLSLYVRAYGENFFGTDLEFSPNFNSNTTYLDPNSTANRDLAPPNFFNDYKVYSNSSHNYYTGHGSSDQIELIYTDKSVFAPSFKKAMKKYFKDCPELIEKIENKEFNKEQIWRVVDFYNRECLGSENEQHAH